MPHMGRPIQTTQADPKNLRLQSLQALRRFLADSIPGEFEEVLVGRVRQGLSEARRPSR